MGVIQGIEQRLEFWLRTIADGVASSGGSGTDIVSAIEDVELSVDENKAQINQLISQSFGSAGWDVLGGTTVEVLTITGGGGTLGIDITSGSATLIAYDEAFSVDIETTIDNWLVTNAAAMLTAHGITATKSAVDEITLTGNVQAGVWTFADGGATMAATSGGQTTTMVAETGPYSVIEIVTDAVFDIPASTMAVGESLPFGYALTAGNRIVGNFTTVKLVSGTALAYLI